MRIQIPILALLLLTPLHASAASPINFSRDIQPILSDNCYFCHGPDAHERHGDLRLDTLADPKLNPFAARDGYNIITPGKPDDSVLVLRITSDDPDDLMPPAKSHRKLTDAQKQLLTEWIQQGAKWGKHWSFVPPILSPIPEVKDQSWPRNPVDNFILARLEKENLHPSPEAPKTTLIRRVTLDLTGLPPTPAEVDAFLADNSPDAYDKVVDRLLASPRYGERMVWEWLDACRYADTNGYQADPTRTVWPWRDWVVRSMNANMPFDQFLTWQLAGDLLPNPTLDQRLASSFNRQNPFNGEGGRIPEETRVENVLDRTDTVGTIFLGLTVGCAKCHDHKFDPISQKDYYSLSAFFNQSSETGQFQYVNGGNVLPVMDYATPEESAQSAKLKKISDDAQAKLKAANPSLNAAQNKWEKSLPPSLATSNWQPATPSSAVSASGASMQILDADHSILVSGKSPDNDTYTITLPANLPTITGLKLEVLPDISLPHGGPGRSPDSGNFVLTNLDLFSIPPTDPTHSAKAQFAYSFSTYDQGGLPSSAAIDADPVGTGWAVFQAPDKNNLSATFALTQPLTLSPSTDLRLVLHFDWKNNKEHTLGRFRVSFTTAPVLPPAVIAALNVPPNKRGKREEKKTISDFYRTYINTEYPPLAATAAAALKASKDFDATVTKVMVMNDAMPRQTYVLIKGGYDNHSTPVPTAIPAVFRTPA
ncbi:MAG TPA: DUF1549 domain-containing protein, partial [Tepidisphaeraceae bacterium]|nr:DUF1549 domain-containing protein [Tepidisphaeraceae bacterium]